MEKIETSTSSEDGTTPAATRSPKARSRWLRRLVVATIGVLGIAFVAIGVVVVRGIELPRPTGPFPVGRIDAAVVDPERAEIFTDDPNDRREILVTIHYPCRREGPFVPSDYASESLQRAADDAYGAPAVLGRLVRCHSCLDGRVAEGPPRRPVVIFSPGLGVPCVFYTAMLEDLASHGYIVASVWHPYSLEITAFPDGRVIRGNKKGMTFGTIVGEASTEEERRNAERIAGEVWIEDVRLALDELARLDREDERFRGRMDLDRVGVFGHSFGGTTAMALACLDERIGAAVNMDGTAHWFVDASRLKAPVLWFSADRQEFSDEEIAAVGLTREESNRLRDKYEGIARDFCKTGPNVTRLRLLGGRHMTFVSDFVVLSETFPFSLIMPDVGTGRVGDHRGVAVVRECVRAFFDEHLKGIAPPAPTFTDPCLEQLWPASKGEEGTPNHAAVPARERAARL